LNFTDIGWHKAWKLFINKKGLLMAIYIFAGIILGGLLFYIIFSLIGMRNHGQRLRKCLNEEIFFVKLLKVRVN